MKTAYLLLTLAVVTAVPGCGCLAMTCHNVAAWTGRHWSAEKAWRERKWMYADIPCRGSFKTGFKAGYRFANGGYDSCEPPALRHYWRIGGLTESERQNAQAWSDGFTHGTVAAQQDHAVGPSALDMAAMQPPAGVPDVRYLTPPETPNAMDQGENFQFSPTVPPPTPYEVPQTQENFRYAPNTMPSLPAPNREMAPPPPAPGVEMAPPPSTLPAPRVTPQRLSPPGGVSAPGDRVPPSPVTVSEGAPGIGSLRTAIHLQPAPPAEPAPPSYSPEQAGNPPRQATQAADWQLPIIRD
jgi:hypothetical protein